MILFSCVVRSKYNIFVWILGRINIKLILWILMAWCFCTRTSGTTKLIKHSCICPCLWVKVECAFAFWTHQKHSLIWAVSHDELWLFDCENFWKKTVMGWLTLQHGNLMMWFKPIVLSLGDYFNPLCAILVWESIKMYLCFLSFIEVA